MSLKRGGQLLDVTASMTRSMDETDEQGAGPTSAPQSPSVNGADPMLNGGGAAAPFSSPTSSGSVAGGISREAAEAVAALQSASTELWQVPCVLAAVRPSVLIRNLSVDHLVCGICHEKLVRFGAVCPGSRRSPTSTSKTTVHASSQCLR